MQNWTAWDLVLVFLMWAVMMLAMMVPAASPVILLFAEINRRRNEQQTTFVATGQFLLGYLTAWTGFSVLATLAQWGLLTAALVSPMMDEPVMGRRYQRLCPAGEDHPSEPIGQPP